MRHDWIFDMLADLQDYARRNDLPDLARKAEETLSVARREIAADRPHLDLSDLRPRAH